MTGFSTPELLEALRSIESTLVKCEKAFLKLQAGTSQHTLLKRRIKSLQIASALITQALETTKQGND